MAPKEIQDVVWGYPPTPLSRLTHSGGPERRPVIVEHSFGDQRGGGLVGPMLSVIDSKLTDEFEFVRMHQESPLGGFSLTTLRVWRALLKSSRPDLLHVRGLGNEGFHAALAGALAGVPRILVTVHGSQRSIETASGLRAARSQVVGRVLEPSTLKMATHVALVSKSSMHLPVVRKASGKIIGVVENGAPPIVFSAHQRQSIRNRLDVPNSSLLITYVGRISHEKGLRYLLEALWRIPRCEPGSAMPTMLFVGDGPELEWLRRVASARTPFDIRVLGRRDDADQILAASDIFAFPSLHENMSLALLEAMASGLAIVATGVGGNRELINSDTGILVPPRNAEALACAIQQLVESPSLRRQFGLAATERVQKHFNSERMIRSWLHTYRAILSDSGPRR